MDLKLSDKEFFIIRTAWHRLNAGEYDSQEGFRRFNRKHRSPRRRIYWLSTAAIALLFITVGYWAWDRNDEIQKNVIAEDIHRAKGLPILTLANGNHIVLNKENLKETIWQAEGAAIIQDRTSSLQYVSGKGQQNAALEYNILEIPKGGEFLLVLADGSKVWLNSETTLRYPVSFTGEKREVELEGEAYFEIAPDTLRPFCVRVGNKAVEVLGTHFNISHYQTDVVWSATLVEGKVKIYSGNDSYIIKPGTQYKENRTTGSSEIVDVNVQMYISWKDGKVTFQDERLEDIIQKIARWYDFEIFYANPAVKELHFGGAINKYNSFKVVLSYLERTAGVRFDIKGKTVVVSFTE